MAAPTPTARSAPAGIDLKDGYQSLITFARVPTASIWEKTVQPPGVDGGDSINTTTMQNSAWRTFSPRHLKTLTPVKINAAYDPNFYNQLIANINIEDTITITFPDGSTLAFFGYLKSIEPAALAEGTFPDASVEIVPTNFDFSAKVEAAPVLTSVAGT